MDPQSTLARTQLFTRAVNDFRLTKDQRQEITHARAEAIAKSFDLTLDDLLTCSEKFWNSHLNGINVIDGAATALWTIHVNLACGSLAQYAAHRPELRELCRKMLAFEVTAHYLLTEIGHGLDTQNIETVVRLLPNGDFEIHTPNPRAAKFMPASIPAGGLPRIAVVMARLLVQERDAGIRPFVVPLNDGQVMYEGVSCRVLPDRSGTRPVGHAITSFNHVRLPSTALVGDLGSPLSLRIEFLTSIWRLGIGSATMAGLCVPALRVGAYIAGKYAKRRTVSNSQGQFVPILSFRTTSLPILHAFAQAAVLEALFKEIRPYFASTEDLDLSTVLNSRNGLAAVFKTLAIRHFRESIVTLTDRLGAQGLFIENQLVSVELEIRGMSIAEGDVTVISIRLASELLLGRYTLPASRYPNSPLARHERGIFNELQAILKGMNNNHRSEDFNAKLLPRSKELVLAIGYRMAYEAALDARVDPLLVDLYQAGAILLDLAWYVENGVTTRQAAIEAEEVALTLATPHLDRFMEESGAEPFIHAPIASDAAWDKYVDSLVLIKRPGGVFEQAKL
ncbi:acyl-CoA dehydrogenase NM domain-like protein [Roridomyces roridus]|uniref:Acyl-CoA dehydrogenase NM domain-like protein n=1 Tax=Roridomyces roridus TaxID=1738132 RepID=A0AAD7B723_9AGAR|nr:acyl-CoA dehydrogenase NM domain-like protein [Roridomyces roridus]